MLNLNSILVSTENPQPLVEFYKKVLDKKPDMEDSGYTGFLVGQTFLSIGAHDQLKGVAKDPHRILLNFETNDVQKEFDRIKALGATVIKEPYGVGPDENYLIATLADPDGNFFQLMPPWEEGK